MEINKHFDELFTTLQKKERDKLIARQLGKEFDDGFSSVSRQDTRADDLKLIEYKNKMRSEKPHRCSKCFDKGVVYFLNAVGCEAVRDCVCVKSKKIYKEYKNVGFFDWLETKSLDRFIVSEDWQMRILKSATGFSSDPKGWFFVGGSQGAGKTHICAGITHRLLENLFEVKYVTNNMVQDFKDYRGSVIYDRKIRALRKFDILVFDDLLGTDMGPPEYLDVKTIEDIFYSLEQKTVVINSKWNFEDLNRISKKISAKIFGKSSGQRFIIEGDKRFFCPEEIEQTSLDGRSQ